MEKRKRKREGEKDGENRVPDVNKEQIQEK